MSRLHTSGFEANAANFVTTEWSNSSGTPSFESGAGNMHSGSYSMKVDPSASTEYVYRTLASAVASGNTFYLRTYFKFSTRPNADCFLMGFQLSTGGGDSGIVYDATNHKLKVHNNVVPTTVTYSSSYTIAADTWYRLELRLYAHDSAGQMEGRLFYGSNLEGTTPDIVWGIGNFSGGNGSNEDTYIAGYNRIPFGAYGVSNTCVGYFDDAAINDGTTGSGDSPACNTWCGPGKIALIKPDGDVSVSWTKAGSAPAGTNAGGVDDVPGTPDDATTYNTDSGATNTDRMSLTALPDEVGSDATIVLLHVYQRGGSDSTAGAPAVTPKLWDESGNVKTGSNFSCDVNGWRITSTNESLVCNGSGKTKANIASWDVGYTAVDDTRVKRITAQWVNVEWQDAITTTTAPTTLPPTTLAPTTLPPTTVEPTTYPIPSTLAPTTVHVATTPIPTTSAPTTLTPTTLAPTTLAPTTLAPTTLPPTTLAPTTLAPTTLAPTTLAPTTLAPTTLPPTTLAPTTLAPTTLAPTTLPPTTLAPTTLAPTTIAPTTLAPTTVAPTTLAPTTLAPTTVAPTTVAPTTIAPTTLAPTTVAPTTLPPTTEAPTTLAPTTLPPTTLIPTTIPPPGTVCWGHDTGVVEDHARDFLVRWSGTGTVSGSGDGEYITLNGAEYMESETWNIGSGRIKVTIDKYAAGAGLYKVEYKNGATMVACEADSWHDYVGSFICSGWVKVRLEVDI